MLQPLVALLADPLESCRLTVLQLLLEAAPVLSHPGALLPGLLPQMVARMGQLPVQETAEEVRLAGLQLLGHWELSPAVEELSLLLTRGCEDAFPDAKKAAAAALVALAGRLPAGALEDQAERLLQALLPSLAHQHSKVRLAVLSGLRALVLSGLPAGMVHSQLAPAVKPLTFDRAAAVREAYYAALASWLGCQQGQQQQDAAAAHARCKTYAPVLLPLLLLGVSDAQETIATAALAAVEQVGAAWQQQQQESAPVLPAVEAPAGQPDPAVTPMDTDDQQQQQQQQGQPAAAAAEASSSPSDVPVSSAAMAAAQLPPPFQGLPAAGCRRMVAVLLPQLLPGILTGLKEWTSSLRSAAARSLHTCLVLAGPAATPHLQQLLAALMAAMTEEEAEIVTVLASCCRVVGAFVPCGAWLPLLVDTLSDPKAGDISRANALVVTSCLVHAAAAAQQQPDQQLLQLLVAALAAEDVRCSEHVGVQLQLLSVVMNLLAWMPAEASKASGQQLYLILLQLHGTFSAQQEVEAPSAAGADDDSSVSRTAAALQQLAQRCGLAGAGQLAEAHAGQMLGQLAADADQWTAGSANLRGFMSLLRTAEGPCLAGLLPQVAQVLQPILADGDRDASLRLGLLRLLDGLMEQPSTAGAFGGHNAALVLSALLVPPLVWRAGKAAAAVRFAAITALSTLLTAHLAPPEVLLAAAQQDGGLLPLLAQCLDEDWYSDVRHTACYVEQLLLQQVGQQLGDESRRAIYPELLKRLDDSSNKVRIAACAALVAFVRSAGSSYCSTNSGYLAAGVVLHMDDGDKQVAEAACQVLEALAVTKPAVAAAEVRKVQERFRARHYCDRVLAACSTADAAT
ncbi:armadillo-type protein [Scenedesmus sp. NREL 46B-D3]|nr:armadillo-type protein [Scenedesmus sp. NREL 46B-D3]